MCYILSTRPTGRPSAAINSHLELLNLQLGYVWLTAEDLRTERQQCLEEGRDIGLVESDFDELMAADLTDRSIQQRAMELLDRTIQLTMRPDYAYHEPSDLAGIRAARPAIGLVEQAPAPARYDLYDKVHGAWAGRCVGCLLGKPVEGWRRDRMWDVLKSTGRWPLQDFFRLDAIPADVRAKHMKEEQWERLPFADRVTAMPEDDDTNYTTTGLAILQKHGPDFTPANVGEFWLQNIPAMHQFTAERVAYRNFLMQKSPPESATFRNPYREWIGAQIRADFWGYAAPGNPELAAEFAWRDACVSHVKNGIYGEMWAAAMIASAFVLDDPAEIIRTGLGQIPEKCRLADYIEHILEWHELEIDYDTAVYRIHEMWDENSGHGWCHTISNAMIVAVGLLWGEGDYAQSICRAVQPCFDTDCNGATVGSILGIIHGRKALPAAWMDVINDTLQTGVAGYHTVKLADITRDSLVQIERVSSGAGVLAREQ
jgi:ADP-ribosylglycohydrolase